jgi:hypothetical protein
MPWAVAVLRSDPPAPDPAAQPVAGHACATAGDVAIASGNSSVAACLDGPVVHTARPAGR